jgi:hypothetical protein
MSAPDALRAVAQRVVDECIHDAPPSLDTIDKLRAALRGAVPLSAPDGPWKIAKPANTTGWHVSPGTPTYPMHHSLWFDTEAQALAVRDALNRVVGAALQQEGDPPNG